MRIYGTQSAAQEPHYVYALLAEEEGRGYVKFGISDRIGARLSSIRTSCPLPVGFISVLDVKTRKKAREVEKALHRRFSDRNITGEWFRFDLSSKEEKREFHDGCKTVFLLEIGPGNEWTHISVEALDEHNRERRSAILGNPKLLRSLQRRERARKRKREAWKELAY